MDVWFARDVSDITDMVIMLQGKENQVKCIVLANLIVTF